MPDFPHFECGARPSGGSVLAVCYLFSSIRSHEVSRQGDKGLKRPGFDLSIDQRSERRFQQAASSQARETAMDIVLADGTVNAAQSGEGPPLFLLHSLLSDR